MRYRAIIWDFDGTLWDTYPALIRAIQLAMGDLGALEEPAPVIGRMLNVTLAHTIEILAGRHSLDAAQFETRIDHHRALMGIDARPPFPGALRVCTLFKAAGGQNYIYTHRDYASLMVFLNWKGVAELFEDMLTRDAGYPRKPNPMGFEVLLARNQLPKHEVLAVGDRDLDIQAGQGAGLHACLFNAQPGDGVRPEYVIDDFDALLPILGVTPV